MVQKWNFEWDTKNFIPYMAKNKAQVGPRVHKILVEGALECELRIKHRAPKRYGFLRASWGHATGDYSAPSGVKKPEGGGIWIEEYLKITQGSTLKYAEIQENCYSGTHLEGQSPYASPTLKEMEPIIKKAIQDELERLFISPT